MKRRKGNLEKAAGLMHWSLLLLLSLSFSKNVSVTGDELITLDFEGTPEATRSLKGPEDAFTIHVDESNARPGVDYKISLRLQRMTVRSCDGTGTSGSQTTLKMEGSGDENKGKRTLSICQNVEDSSFKDTMYFERSVRVWAEGLWSPGDEAQFLATIFYERDSCSECPITTICCDSEGGCNGNKITKNSKIIASKTPRNVSNSGSVTAFNMEPIAVMSLVEKTKAGNSDLKSADTDSMSGKVMVIYGDISDTLGNKPDLTYFGEFGVKARCFPAQSTIISCDGGDFDNCTGNCTADGSSCDCETHWHNGCVKSRAWWTALLGVLVFVITPTSLAFLLCYHRQMGCWSHQPPVQASPLTISSPHNDLPPTYEEIEEPPPCFCYATSTMDLSQTEVAAGSSWSAERGTRDGGVDNPSFVPPSSTQFECTCGRRAGGAGGRGRPGRWSVVSDASDTDWNNATWSRYSLRRLITRVSPSRGFFGGRNQNNNNNNNTNNNERTTNHQSTSSIINLNYNNNIV